MVKILCSFLFVSVYLQTAFCGSESSSITAAANNATGTPTVESNTGVEDYLTAFLEPPNCGRNFITTKRVVGGKSAQLGEYPWMALLGYHTRRGPEWKCGGSLFSMRHVLTAAHCIYYYNKTLYVVRLGELDYDTENDGAIHIDLPIKKMFIHEKYDPNNSDKSNDIGILILQKDVVFTNLIQPICIPHNQWRQETFENYYAVIGGWGLTSNRGIPSSHLQFARLPICNNSVCGEISQNYKGLIFDDSVICTSDDKADSCDGDSGGPLMTELGTGDKSGYFVTGVISFGLQCKSFTIYTRVTHFMPWIEEKVLGRVTSSPQP